jgi:UDP-2,4-diacetamido-2,4,6-trideoxy-beta-L-altropyranose hydrolase
MNRRPRILFFADGGPDIGGGHVMRCLTLARALGERTDCAFAATPVVKPLIETFAPSWIQALNTPEATVEQVRALASAFSPEWLVIDHYRLTRAGESALRAPGRRLMVMDDLADRPRDCDLLLDPGYGRVAEDYRGLVPDGADVLAGPSYALVRPEFAAARAQALARRGEGSVRRVLVSLGLTDVGGVTGRVVQALLPVLGEVQLDIALGSAAPSLGAIETLDDRRVLLHVDTPDMARLMKDADLAIGAGGSSVWERACLGLPGVTVILANNQRELALRMQADGLTVAVHAAGEEFESSLSAAHGQLAGDQVLRAAISTRLAALCDGLGAHRVAEMMLP